MIEHLPDRLDLYAMAEAGREVRGRIKLASLTRVLPLLESDAGELDVMLSLGKDEGGTHTLTGSVSGRLLLQCQRCLESMDYPLQTTFRLGLVFSQDAAGDLPDSYEPLLVSREPAVIAEVVTEEVLLALPIVPLHEDRADCRELKTDYAASAGVERENPFAVLAQLKQK
ncbi:MAG: YceD family protein [Pseudomonadota bacterium]